MDENMWLLANGDGELADVAAGAIDNNVGLDILQMNVSDTNRVMPDK